MIFDFVSCLLSQMAIHMGALVQRVRAFENDVEAAQTTSKAFELKVSKLSFSNDDLKARMQSL